MSDYQIEVDENARLVLAVFKGLLTVKAARAVTRDARSKAFELGYSTFYDFTEAVLPKDTSLDYAYYFPRDVEKIYVDPIHRKGRMAILVDPDKDRDFWKFYEITANNAGIHMKIFYSREEAVKWLSQSRRP